MTECKGHNCKEQLDKDWLDTNGNKCIDCMYEDHVEDLIGQSTLTGVLSFFCSIVKNKLYNQIRSIIMNSVKNIYCTLCRTLGTMVSTGKESFMEGYSNPYQPSNVEEDVHLREPQMDYDPV